MSPSRIFTQGATRFLVEMLQSNTPSFAPVAAPLPSRGDETVRSTSIVGFGAGMIHRNDLPTTQMVIPDWELARTAVEMLIQKIRAPDRRIKSKCIAFDAPVGESVAPPS
jgi:DNA-binding LacI/PurR family transcriptional regulator